MARILVHVTVGPEDRTRAALAFFVARAVVEEGHQLVLFVAGDGVYLLTETHADSLEGLGTGKLSEHLATINSGSAEVYFSGMSAKARNVTLEDIVLTRAQAGSPSTLVRLIAGCDRVITY